MLLFKMPVSHQKPKAPNVLTLRMNDPRMGFVLCLRLGGEKRQADMNSRLLVQRPSKISTSAVNRVAFGV